MATYLKMVRFYYPNEGALTLLRLAQELICNGCPISVATVPPLYTVTLNGLGADFTIAEGLVYGDLTVLPDADLSIVEMNTEAAPTYCLGGFEGPNYNGEGIAELTVDMQEQTAAADITVFGALLWTDFGDGEVILGIARFDQPAVMLSGDILKVVGVLQLPSSVPGDEA